MTAVDRGEVSVLVWLDLLAAFNTVDHDILLPCLQYSYGVTGCAHRWFQSDLCGRIQYVRLGSTKSSVVHLF
jgi:hypothetical protein